MPGMKAVDKKANPGLAKLPTEVRNKMGYMKKGGTATAKKKMQMGGSVTPVPTGKIPFVDEQQQKQQIGGSMTPGMMNVGGMPKKKKKVEKVMSEYKKGTLKSSSGSKVKNPKQAIAIALSEAGMSKPKAKKKKA